MAPAAQYRGTLHIITTTTQVQLQNEAEGPKNTMDTTDDAVKELSMSKATDSVRSTSNFNWPSTTPNVKTTRHFTIPQIQGIVPGIRHALHIDAASPSLPQSLRSPRDVALAEKPSLSARLIPSTLITSTPPSPHHSTYPRVSPPGFLYPETIVPHAAISTQNSNLLQHPESVSRNKSPYHSSIMGRVDFKLVYLPTGYKVLLVGTLATLVLGIVWTLLIWVVNKRMDMVLKSGAEEGKERKGRR
ncbi:hypothetical protein G6011_03313 [Alternaria panax]|uniref:Uncharacterized protein n=1 Tax=Alternaria panax TaxID=48097 RepID=A0AAD4IEL0_9PLEO|nr:hypothetical protein G6011_03313 [Alternaria panax]